MTREEFSVIVKGLKAVYTEPTFIPDQYSFDVWFELLKDLDYVTVNKAVQKHMLTSRYTPKIADIRQQCVTLEQKPQIGETQAWSLVSEAIRNSTYHSEEEFEKLPAVVQKAVGSPHNLREKAIDENYNDGVEKSNFIRQYRIELERERTRQSLPEGLRERLPDSLYYGLIKTMGEAKS